MPLIVSFTVGQSPSSPDSVVFEDTSTGTDVAVTQRRIYITDNDGNAVVPSGTATAYIAWPLATNPITVSNLLTVDLAVNIDVQWLDVSNNILYEDDNEFCLREFNKQNFIYLIQNQALSPGVVQDETYFSNLCQYWINIVGANVMVEDAVDLSGSQNCLNRATNMLDNQQLFF